MATLPSVSRALAVLCTGVILAGVLGTMAWVNSAAEPVKSTVDAPKDHALRPWPLWGGSLDRNMVNTVESNIASDWNVLKNKRKNIKWVADLGSKAYGGPVVADGKIFIGTNNENPRNPEIKGDKGIVMCFRESDGKFLWQAVHDKLEAGRVNDWPREGICSTPYVEGKRLYYVSNRCEVICADTEGFLDGKNDGVQDEKYKSNLDADIIWRLDMIKDLNVFPHNLSTSSPVVIGDTLYIVTSNGVDEGHINIPSPQAPSFLAIDKNTGKVLWQSNSPGEKIMHGQWSSPVYAEANGKPQIIFPGGDGYLRGYDPKSGQVLWRFDCNPKDAKYVLGGKGTKSDFIGTPVVYDNKAYIGVGQDPEHDHGIGHFWCIDITKVPTNKDKDISPELELGKSNPESGMVWHFGGPAPAELQRNYLFGRTMSTAAIHDGLVYITELAGIVHCLDAKTGKQYWEHDMEADTWGSTYWVDGKVYIGNEEGNVLIFADGKEKKLLAELSMIDKDSGDPAAKVRNTPVAANGVLYIATENKLYAIK
jgi:outer membrane protein assembly factor BamB